MHILVLYQYFHSPDAPGTGRHYSFTARWAANHRVTVITSESGFTAPVSGRFPAAPEGVNVASIPVRYANRMGVGQRLLAYRRYAQNAVRIGKRLDRPDIVFGTSTPLSVAWAARKIAHHWKIPWVFEVRDLWPDFPIEMGAIPTPWLQNRIRNIERGLYGDADHVITLSSDMEDHVLRCGGDPERVTTLVNGTSFELLDASTDDSADALRREHGLVNKKLILYAGTLGRANGIPSILETASQLRSREDLAFVFVGSGYFKEAVDRAAAREPNVFAFPAVAKHEIFAWHRTADLSLVTFIDKPVLATNSPSKFFDSLACGTPVLVTNPGWTRRFVEQYDCGWSVDGLNPTEMASTLTEIFRDPSSVALKGHLGSKVARSLFDRQQMADHLEQVFTGLTGKSKRQD